MKHISEINNEQKNSWSGEFGNQYIERNNSLDVVNNDYRKLTGLTYHDIFSDFFQDLDKNIMILELGCNVGNNFSILKTMGFTKLYGLDTNTKAIDIAKSRHADVCFYNSSIEECKLPEKHFDLVFTAGVLIHMNPNALRGIIEKILSLTKRYVFGFESYSESLTEVFYQNKHNMYWKQNFPQLFKKISPNLNLLKQKKIQYIDSDLLDIAYLFEL